MVGQTKLAEQFNSMTLDTLHHSIILEGEFGCGKHTFVKYLANKYSVKVIEINKVTADVIIDLNNFIDTSFIIFDATNLSINEQNALLKFIEEPKANIFIFILCETSNHLIDAIINRCQRYLFEPYSIDDLDIFYANCIDQTYQSYEHKQICINAMTTPGLINIACTQDLVRLKTIADKIFCRIDKINVANILQLSNMVDCSGKEPLKFNLIIFIYILDYCGIENLKVQYTDKVYKQLRRLDRFRSDILWPNIDRKKLLDNFLLDLKRIE